MVLLQLHVFILIINCYNVQYMHQYAHVLDQEWGNGNWVQLITNINVIESNV